jgi:hypothetical protein
MLQSKKNVMKKSKEQEDKEALAPLLYPAGEDIYSKEKELKGAAPDGSEDAEWGTREPKDELMGGDLDVPGAELDDEDEKIGEEDEENNYYSVGGDDHNDLDEGNEDEQNDQEEKEAD